MNQLISARVYLWVVPTGKSRWWTLGNPGGQRAKNEGFDDSRHSPALQGTDGIDLRDADHAAQGLERRTATFPHLQTQSTAPTTQFTQCDSKNSHKMLGFGQDECVLYYGVISLPLRNHKQPPVFLRT